jgi:trans-aconitate methyltransferase
MSPDPEPPPGIDVSRPAAARIYDHLLGGSHNYAVDRQFAARFEEEWPGIAQNARINRSWVQRVVRLIAAEGIDQFLDIGSGLPTAQNVHQVAQAINPNAKVMYVDNDPIVLAHGRALLEGPHSAYEQASVQDHEVVLAQASQHLDLSQPIAFVLSAVLHYVAEEPAPLVARYLHHLAPGSYVAVTHVITEDVDPAFTRQLADQFPDMHPRPIASIQAIFDGLEVLAPGVVDAQLWRPEENLPIGPQRLIAGVGRKA